MTTKWLVLLLLAVAAATAGCSPAASTSPSNAAAAVPKSLAASLPTASGTLNKPANLPDQPAPPGNASATDKADLPPSGALPVSPFPEMGDLFAPPKIVVPVVSKEPEPELQPQPEANSAEPKKEKALPQLRLIGFVEVEGLKALLAVEGKLKVVTIGDSAEGLQIVAIEPPAVTLKHGDDGEEFQMNLFDQPWFHQPDAIAAERRTFGGKPLIQKNSPAPGIPNLGTPPLPPSAGSTLGPGPAGAAPSGAAPHLVPGPPGPGLNGPPDVPGISGPPGPPPGIGRVDRTP